MYTISIGSSGWEDAANKLLKVSRILDEKKDDIALAALHGAASVFERNFDTEGRTSSSPWPALATSTQYERESLGFNGKHPILVRYGSLKYATSTYLKTAPKTGAFFSADSQGKTVGINVSAIPDGVTVVAYGEKAANQVGGGPTDVPARQYWFSTSQVIKKAHDGAVDGLASLIGRIY